MTKMEELMALCDSINELLHGTFPMVDIRSHGMRNITITETLPRAEAIALIESFGLVPETGETGHDLSYHWMRGRDSELNISVTVAGLPNGYKLVKEAQ